MATRLGLWICATGAAEDTKSQAPSPHAACLALGSGLPCSSALSPWV